MQRATSFSFLFSVPSPLLNPNRVDRNCCFLSLESIFYDCYADIQRREFEDAHWACVDHCFWRVSAYCEPSFIASCVLLFLTLDGVGTCSFIIDVFNLAQTSVAILALVALVFL